MSASLEQLSSTTTPMAQKTLPSSPSRRRSHGARSHRKRDAMQPADLDEFSLNYVNDGHTEAFARALAMDLNDEPIEHISAVTDFMPIHQPIKLEAAPKDAAGFMYYILRYPLMLIIFGIISLEMLFYVIVRQIVALFEFWYTWRGERARLRTLLNNSNNYDEWVQNANALDAFLKNDEWKDQIPFGHYDYTLLQKVVRDLRKYREGLRADPQKLRSVLQDCIKSNFAGVENTRLYSHTYFGTKTLVEDYINQATESLDYIRTCKSLPFEDKRQLFKLAYKNYGRTALCLSGGAGFGYYHLGVVKALFDANLLPNVITGTSAGGLIAALVCVRTDDELRQVLDPKLNIRLNACSEEFSIWFKRYLEIGARFCSVDWARKTQWICKGSLTFREAYERTGRILNISVIPSDPHSPPKLLNYITAPDCVIWSAVIASAAVPGIINPVVLMKKTKNGDLVPYSYGHRWKDGSLRTDIPVQALHMHFNVKFTIVSQVNPHVHMFFFSSRGHVGRPSAHRLGRGWRGGFVLSGLEQYLKLDLVKWLKVLRDLELLPRFKDQDWGSVFLQRFDGNITIWPKTSIWDFIYIMSDPDHDRLSRLMYVGQHVTWPKLNMIANRLKTERALLRGRHDMNRELSHRRRHQRWNSGPDGAAVRGATSKDERSALMNGVVEVPNALSVDGGARSSDTDSGNATEVEPQVSSVSEVSSASESSESSESSPEENSGLITPVANLSDY